MPPTPPPSAPPSETALAFSAMTTPTEAGAITARRDCCGTACPPLPMPARRNQTRLRTPSAAGAATANANAPNSEFTSRAARATVSTRTGEKRSTRRTFSGFAAMRAEPVGQGRGRIPQRRETQPDAEQRDEADGGDEQERQPPAALSEDQPHRDPERGGGHPAAEDERQRSTPVTFRDEVDDVSGDG